MKIIKDQIINTPASMLTIPAGKSVSIRCQDFSPFSTVKSAASRLNQRAGRVEFEVSTPDNGATIMIKRNCQ